MQPSQLVNYSLLPEMRVTKPSLSKILRSNQLILFLDGLYCTVQLPDRIVYELLYVTTSLKVLL